MSDRLTPPYKYQSFRLDHNGNSTIRVMLLTPSKNVDDFLTCRIVHKTLHDCSSYHALSYTWGEPVFSKTLVVDKSMRIPITENLDFALRRLRLAGIRALWVDAICINQQDVQERAQQVRLMGRIFSQAKRVIIWTGLDNASRDGWHCLEHLDRLSTVKSSLSYDERFRPLSTNQKQSPLNDRQTCSPKDPQKFATSRNGDGCDQRRGTSRVESNRRHKGSNHVFDKSAQDTYARFGNRPHWGQLTERTSKHDYDVISRFLLGRYFSRRWIIQEIALASKVVIYCGGASISGKAFFKSIAYLLHLENQNWAGLETAISLSRIMALSTRRESAWNHIDSSDDDQESMVSRYTPVGLLREFFRFQCFDKRDFVLSLLGIFEMYLGDTPLAPDDCFRNITYENSISEVYTALATYQLRFQTVHDLKKDTKMLRFSDIELLLLAGATRRKQDGEEASLDRTPSWVPDWRNPMRYEVMSSRSLNNFDNHSTGGKVDFPWIARNDSDLLVSRPVPSSILEVWGVPFDIIAEVLSVDLTKSIDRTRLRLRIASWKTIDYYTDVSGSLVEAISEVVVTHCYNLDTWARDFTQWIQDNRRTIIDVLDRDYDRYDIEHIQEILSRTMRGRSIFLTKGGYIGIACEDAEPGDTVAVLRDSPVTFILRNLVNPQADARRHTGFASNEVSMHAHIGPYELIGDAHVHALDLLSFEKFDPRRLQIY
jgi:hypothetical protein